MTERERLISLINAVTRYSELRLGVPITSEYLADYLLENGIIVPPCKISDKVYIISLYNKIEEYEICSVRCGVDLKSRKFLYEAMKRDEIINFFDTVIGEEIFFTKEEAEKALKERDKKCD